MKLTILAASLLISTLAATPLLAHEFKQGALTITHPWARPTPPGLTVTAVYFGVKNNGKTADRLIGYSSSAAGRTELHETRMEGGMARLSGWLLKAVHTFRRNTRALASWCCSKARCVCTARRPGSAVLASCTAHCSSRSCQFHSCHNGNRHKATPTTPRAASLWRKRRGLEEGGAVTAAAGCRQHRATRQHRDVQGFSAAPPAA